MKHRTEPQWRLLFAEYTRSGISATAFCQARGLSQSYFSQRQRQLGLVSQDKPPAFVPLTVTKPSGTIELWVTETIKLHVPPSIPADWLVCLLKGLR